LPSRFCHLAAPDSDWSGQLQKYFETINSYYIAKQILFQAAQFQDKRIVPEEIAQQVQRPKACPEERGKEVQHTLKQLAFAEMIDSDGKRDYQIDLKAGWHERMWIIGCGWSRSNIGREESRLPSSTNLAQLP